MRIPTFSCGVVLESRLEFQWICKHDLLQNIPLRSLGYAAAAIPTYQPEVK